MTEFKLKGGSWRSLAASARLPRRLVELPDDKGFSRGFRLIRRLTPAQQLAEVAP